VGKYQNYAKLAAFLLFAVSMSSLADEVLQSPKILVYREGFPDNTLEMYRPADASVKTKEHYPALVLFHGGAWARGDADEFARQSPWLSQRAGLVVFSVNYPTHRNPVESTLAAMAAICWVKSHANELGIDQNRIAAGGGSAGGQLALIAAIAPTHLDVPGCKQVSLPYVEALVLFNPVIDLSGKWERLLKMKLRDVSPMDALQGPLPPTLIVQGTLDRIAPIVKTRRFIEKAKKLGAGNIQMIEYPGREHGFFNKEPDTESTLQDSLEFLRKIGWADQSAHNF
jgi:acetyl esterase/lipase